MIASTELRDCLYLNWALRRETAPPLPPPLRYEIHDGDDGAYFFASAVLFRHAGARLTGFPLVRVSHPQMNLRFYVIDQDEMPAVFFRAFFVPAWILPVSRALTGATSHWAWLRYPRLDSDPESASWSWKVRRGERLEVRAKRGSGGCGGGVALGSWAETVAYFRQRPRGYLVGDLGLKRIDTSHPAAEVWPLAAEIGESGLIERYLPSSGGSWRAPHSSFLCPRIQMVFDTAPSKEPRLARQVAATG